MNEDELADEVAFVNQMLLRAGEYGIQAEVVTCALMHMHDFPTLSVSEAIQYGYDEWLK
jgi:hypothetical protein